MGKAERYHCLLNLPPLPSRHGRDDFDTLSIAKRLEAAGFSSAQAEAMTAVVSEASDPIQRELVKRQNLQIELAPVRTDLGLLKWMIGVKSALTIGVLLKLFLV